MDADADGRADSTMRQYVQYMYSVDTALFIPQ